MKKILFNFLIILPCICFSQKQGSNWIFGDSAYVDFTDTSNIITGTSSAKSRGSCASISDSAGNLLFYSTYDIDTYTIGGPPYKNGEIFNKLHNTMDNGDSIVMQGWYREVVITTDPGTINQFYVFSIGVVNSSKGIYYSIVDMNANGGLGKVIQKNTPLIQTFQMVDCLTAIKHGNGRDWWILFRRWNSSPVAPNTEFHSYLVSPAGITNYSIQNIGSIQSSGFGGFAWTNDGNRFAYFNPQGLLELYNFDRCTGIISNPVNIHTESTGPPYETYWGAAFSPSDSLLYVTKFPLYTTDTSRLYQFEIFAPVIAASSDTLKETFFIETMDHLKLAFDGKIYLATNYYQIWPYSDTAYNTINTNLSVINYPDSLGFSCNLQSYSFYLGGMRTYGSLPNNPNYHLGPKIGSGCDTLTAINEHSQQVVISNLSPNPNNGEFTVNYFLPNGKSGELEVFNATGQKVFYQRLPRYTYMQNLNLKNPAEGIYLLKISGNGKVAVRKFVLSK